MIIGRGVYKSTDAGKTWQFSGLKEAGQIAKVKVNPKDPNIAFAAAVGNPFAWGPDRGVYRTKDGGKTWQKVLFINDQTGAVSVAINWSNPSEVYAGAWRAQRKAWTIISGGPAAEGGVYKSTDGGDHWTRSSNGLPEDLIGKVWIDVAQSNPRVRLRAGRSQGREGRAVSLERQRRALDAGEQLGSAPRAAVLLQQGVRRSEERERRLGDRARSAPLDRRRQDVGDRRHAARRQSRHVAEPGQPAHMIESNDGGANITQDGGSSWSSQLNQPTAELYMVDADEQFPYRLYAPQQDDGTVVVVELAADR